MKLKHLLLPAMLLFSTTVIAQDQSYYVVFDAPISIDPLQARKDAWAAAAESINKTIPEDWSNGLNWSRGCCGTPLEGLPAEPYPASTIGGINLAGQYKVTSLDSFANIEEVTGGINLSATGIANLEVFSGKKISRGGKKHQHINMSGLGLTSLKGLELLNDIGYTYFHNNNLENVDGLIGLSKVSVLILKNNRLKNIDGLSNLRRFGYHARFDVAGNPDLNDLSPLNNVEYFRRGNFTADNRPYVTKMSGTSLICQQILSGTSSAKYYDPNDPEQKTKLDLDPNYICAY